MHEVKGNIFSVIQRLRKYTTQVLILNKLTEDCAKTINIERKENLKLEKDTVKKDWMIRDSYYIYMKMLQWLFQITIKYLI